MLGTSVLRNILIATTPLMIGPSLAEARPATLNDQQLDRIWAGAEGTGNGNGNGNVGNFNGNGNVGNFNGNGNFGDNFGNGNFGDNNGNNGATVTVPTVTVPTGTAPTGTVPSGAATTGTAPTGAATTGTGPASVAPNVAAGGTTMTDRSADAHAARVAYFRALFSDPSRAAELQALLARRGEHPGLHGWWGGLGGGHGGSLNGVPGGMAPR